MWSATAASVGRLRIFLESKSAGNGRARDRSLSARPEHGPRVEHRRNRARSGANESERSASATFAAEVAKRRRRAWYKKRKGMVEPVIGILKEQRGMRQFQRRGQPAIAVEWVLAAIAYNLIRYRNLRRKA